MQCIQQSNPQIVMLIGSFASAVDNQRLLQQVAWNVYEVGAHKMNHWGPIKPMHASN